MELGLWAGVTHLPGSRHLFCPNTLKLFYPECDSCAPALYSRKPGAVLCQGSRAWSCLALMLPSLLRDAALKPRTTKSQVALPGDGCPSLMCGRKGQELRHSMRTSQQNQKEGSVFCSRFIACGLGTQLCCSREA